jgi:hypothetical protein
MSTLQKTVKFMRTQITYDGPLVSYLTYDGPNTALVDYSNLQRPRLDLRRLSLNYEGPNATVVDYNLRRLNLSRRRLEPYPTCASITHRTRACITHRTRPYPFVFPHRACCARPCRCHPRAAAGPGAPSDR